MILLMNHAWTEPHFQLESILNKELDINKKPPLQVAFKLNRKTNLTDLNHFRR